MKNGVSLYRDSHHLSVAGAMAMAAHLSQGLMTVLAERRDVVGQAATVPVP